MAKGLETGLGKVNVSNNVTATIAGVAASECYGLVGMVSRKVKDGIAELLNQEHYSKGVQVTMSDEGVSVELYIMVEYGTKISEVAHNVMEKVTYAVETMVGLKVNQVNVFVQGVRVSQASRALKTE